MWGTCIFNGILYRSIRFIPTYVGNITTEPGNTYKRSVHPHVCGEHRWSCCFSFCWFGSSPRMWGTFKYLGNGRWVRRFIPTYVGNMDTFGFFRNRVAVHPHVCGEHHRTAAAALVRVGSSPRMWGTYMDPRPGSKQYRFIPTYVGNMIHICKERRDVSVHPHVCGEHCSIRSAHAFAHGSSPRMWGTLLPVMLELVRFRFIPTYVGNIHTAGVSCSRFSVHPHVCGEHILASL